jgi:hypothetical protein
VTRQDAKYERVGIEYMSKVSLIGEFTVENQEINPDQTVNNPAHIRDITQNLKLSVF